MDTIRVFFLKTRVLFFDFQQRVGEASSPSPLPPPIKVPDVHSEENSRFTSFFLFRTLQNAEFSKCPAYGPKYTTFFFTTSKGTTHKPSKVAAKKMFFLCACY